MYYTVAFYTQTVGPSPKTRIGRVMMVTLGFTTIILLAAYTTNLTAYLAAESWQVQPITSMQSAYDLGKKVCVSTPNMERVWALYPEMIGNLHEVTESSQEPTKSLNEGTCGAAVMSQDQFDGRIAKNSNLCKYEIGRELYPSGVTDANAGEPTGAVAMVPMVAKLESLPCISVDLRKVVRKKVVARHAVAAAAYRARAHSPSRLAPWPA